MTEVNKSCCVFCKYFYFNPSDPGYSEYTPGSDTEVGCRKNKWNSSNMDSQTEFEKAMKMSTTCLLFEEAEDD